MGLGRRQPPPTCGLEVPVSNLYLAISAVSFTVLIGVEIMHKDSKYVLFLDDDVRLHGSIGALTAEMEKNPEDTRLIYLLEVCEVTASMNTICSAVVSSFGLVDGPLFFTGFVYQEMHADDFRNSRHGVVSDLRDGRYSDDMTLAAIADIVFRAHKRLITSPPVAVFPHPLASVLSFSRFVLELLEEANICSGIIHDKVNWIMNRAYTTKVVSVANVANPIDQVSLPFVSCLSLEAAAGRDTKPTLTYSVPSSSLSKAHSETDGIAETGASSLADRTDLVTTACLPPKLSILLQETSEIEVLLSLFELGEVLSFVSSN
ncbi:hypothetical protein RHMOL_Rhmol09G0095200 [Rhododendron molle]|uniref:Uncharacterized protein n=1 Tax=Rhododendron molle TaxID=49168 RepID=A0ACC0MCR2_RHOML|nr:hypothetical protein RHMOL_Rhmol09G0095200 [Rhododendron molle]